MGVYVYRVTSRQVELDNGENANVAVFAYKDGWDTSARHQRSGAAACDRAAARGERLAWVVLGHRRDDGVIEVDIGSSAKKIGPIGSFRDGWFGCKEAETSHPGDTVSGPHGRKVMLTRTDDIPSGDGVGEYRDYELRRDQWVLRKVRNYRRFGA